MATVHISHKPAPEDDPERVAHEVASVEAKSTLERKQAAVVQNTADESRLESEQDTNDKRTEVRNATKLNLQSQERLPYHHLIRRWMQVVIDILIVATGFTLTLTAVEGLGFPTGHSLGIAAALTTIEVLFITAVGITMQRGEAKFSKPALALIGFGGAILLFSFWPRYDYFLDNFYVDNPFLAAVFVTVISVGLVALGVWTIAYQDQDYLEAVVADQKAESQLATSDKRLRRLKGRTSTQRAALEAEVNAATVRVQAELTARGTTQIPFNRLRQIVAEHMGLTHVLRGETA